MSDLSDQPAGLSAIHAAVIEVYEGLRGVIFAAFPTTDNPTGKASLKEAYKRFLRLADALQKFPQRAIVPDPFAQKSQVELRFDTSTGLAPLVRSVGGSSFHDSVVRLAGQVYNQLGAGEYHTFIDPDTGNPFRGVIYDKGYFYDKTETVDGQIQIFRVDCPGQARCRHFSDVRWTQALWDRIYEVQGSGLGVFCLYNEFSPHLGTLRTSLEHEFATIIREFGDRLLFKIPSFVPAPESSDAFPKSRWTPSRNGVQRLVQTGDVLALAARRWEELGRLVAITDYQERGEQGTIWMDLFLHGDQDLITVPLRLYSDAIVSLGGSFVHTDEAHLRRAQHWVGRWGRAWPLNRASAPASQEERQGRWLSPDQAALPSEWWQIRDSLLGILRRLGHVVPKVILDRPELLQQWPDRDHPRITNEDLLLWLAEVVPIEVGEGEGPPEVNTLAIRTINDPHSSSSPDPPPNAAEGGGKREPQAGASYPPNRVSAKHDQAGRLRTEVAIALVAVAGDQGGTIPIVSWAEKIDAFWAEARSIPISSGRALPQQPPRPVSLEDVRSALQLLLNWVEELTREPDAPTPPTPANSKVEKVRNPDGPFAAGCFRYQARTVTGIGDKQWKLLNALWNNQTGLPNVPQLIDTVWSAVYGRTTLNRERLKKLKNDLNDTLLKKHLPFVAEFTSKGSDLLVLSPTTPNPIGR